MLNKFSKITRLNIFIILLFLLLFFIYRLTFFIIFKTDDLAINDIIYAFYIGLKFDLRLAIIIVLPIFFIAWIKYLSPLKNNIFNKIWKIYLTLIFSFLLLVFFLDFGHYSYLHTHLDKTILRFIYNTTISAIMLWQSYPLLKIILFFITLIIIFYKSITIIFNKIKQQQEYKLSLIYKIIINTTIAIAIFMALFGKISTYPLRWVDAYFSPNSFIADLTHNPALYAYDTLRYADTNYDIKLTQKYFPIIKKYLKLNPNNKALNYNRELIPTTIINKKVNVVLVFLESFAGYKTGLFGNPLNSSPNFDKLAKNSLFFKNFYVAHTGTARSVFANITSLIDTQLVKTATRNPLIVEQNTVIDVFNNYEKFYFLGGNANWGNIRGVLKNNIDNLHIIEEGDYKAPIQDVWGISDADLFLAAAKTLKRSKKPFFAIIQTSGNHRPYTIPQPNYNFKAIKFSDNEVKKYGFQSLKELNSFHFMDHSIGLFIKQMQQNKLYENTIFVFFADHGINYNNGKHRPKFETKLNIGSYHVPLIIHSPKFITPRVNTTIMSHIDTLPTLAGLMGKKYTLSGLGRNMLNDKYKNEQYAFFIEHGVIPTIGVIGKNFLFSMRADDTKERLSALTDNIADIQKHNIKLHKMKQLTLAIYHTNKYLLYHNKKQDTK